VPQERLSRAELIDLVRRIMNAEGETEEEADAMVRLFEANVPRPGAADLIFWPEHALGDQYAGRELTPEEVVDIALSYRPIAL
jgi:Colicin immunity protein / pyocin immunity protein